MVTVGGSLDQHRLVFLQSVVLGVECDLVSHLGAEGALLSIGEGGGLGCLEWDVLRLHTF